MTLRSAIIDKEGNILDFSLVNLGFTYFIINKIQLFFVNKQLFSLKFWFLSFKSKIIQY